MKELTESQLFPYEKFIWRLEITDKKDKKICWFECEEHAKKFISRHKWPKNSYLLSSK
jgi:hypothetical protein